jgi:hypothetical protein
MKVPTWRVILCSVVLTTAVVASYSWDSEQTAEAAPAHKDAGAGSAGSAAHGDAGAGSAAGSATGSAAGSAAKKHSTDMSDPMNQPNEETSPDQGTPSAPSPSPQ